MDNKLTPDRLDTLIEYNDSMNGKLTLEDVMSYFDIDRRAARLWTQAAEIPTVSFAKLKKENEIYKRELLEHKVVEEYTSGLSIEEIMWKHMLSANTVYLILRSNSIALRGHKKKQNLYFVDQAKQLINEERLKKGETPIE